MRNTCVYVAGVAALILAIAEPASAQSVEPAASKNSSQLEEVLVLAQRREQRMEDVPITLNAISGDSALNMGVTGTAGLQAVVPSLVVPRRANGATPYLRGVGFSSGDPNAENSVAVYVDGVYWASPAGNFFEFNNLERIEVLKGPQGTLFGRNATGGVIQVFTKDPTFDPQAEMSVGYGNYDTVSGSLYGSVGLGEKVAANAAVMYADQSDGWGTNFTTGSDVFPSKEYSVRTKLMWLPTDKTKIILAADFSHLENSAIGGQVVFGTSGLPRNVKPGDMITTVDPLTNAVVTIPAPSGEHLANNAVGQPFPGEFNTNSNHEDGNDSDHKGVSLLIDHDFGPTQFYSLSAYRKINPLWDLDQDISPLTIVSATLHEEAENFQQEFHLLSPSDAKLQWLIGVNYFYAKAGVFPETIDTDPAFGIFGPGVSRLAFENQTVAESYSVFGQATYPIMTDTRLTLGLRNTWDSSDFDSKVDLSAPFFPGGSATVFEQSEARLSYDKPTWRISIDHNFTPDVMAYVSYNRGIKSGNFSVTVADPELALYQPEQLDAYEVGLKNELLDRRARFNTAAFYYEYKDMQFQQIIRGATQTMVVPNAKLWGLEGDIDFRATDNLTIVANAAYLHTEFGDFPGAPVTYRTIFGISEPILAVNGAPYNATGNQLQNAPEFSGSVGATYEIPSSVGDFSISGNAYYTAKYFNEPDNRLSVPSHAVYNAALNWTSSDGHLSIRLWGKNLSDEYYYAQQTGQAGGTDIGGPAAPRTYGFTATYDF